MLNITIILTPLFGAFYLNIFNCTTKNGLLRDTHNIDYFHYREKRWYLR